MRRERNNYSHEVSHSPHIQASLDVIGSDKNDVMTDVMQDDVPLCMVFEWMEQDLRSLPSEPFRQNSSVPKVIAKSILSALADLKTPWNCVHTGKAIRGPAGVGG